MNRKITIISYFIIVGICFSCEGRKPKANEDCIAITINNGIKIMPLGDSRVEGSKPDYESYRYELWKNLMENDWGFDFIGTRRENAFYLDYEGICFDLDHEGAIGALTNDILQTIIKMPDEIIPDVVLLGIGINDLAYTDVPVEEAIANINSIINELKSRNNNITIFLERIAPRHTTASFEYFDFILNEFNDLILNIAIEQTNANSRVFIVDMFSDWSDNYLVDDLHYNEVGAKYVADKYFESMEMNL